MLILFTVVEFVGDTVDASVIAVELLTVSLALLVVVTAFGLNVDVVVVDVVVSVDIVVGVETSLADDFSVANVVFSIAATTEEIVVCGFDVSFSRVISIFTPALTRTKIQHKRLNNCKNFAGILLNFKFTSVQRQT